MGDPFARPSDVNELPGVNRATPEGFPRRQRTVSPEGYVNTGEGEWHRIHRNNLWIQTVFRIKTADIPSILCSRLQPIKIRL